MIVIHCQDFAEYRQPSKIILGDNHTISAFGKGTYWLLTDIEGQPQKIALYDVLYLMELRRNLLSVHAMTNCGTTVEFQANKSLISCNSKVLGIGLYNYILHAELYHSSLASPVDG